MYKIRYIGYPLHHACRAVNDDIVRLLFDIFEDSINIFLLDNATIPVYYIYLTHHSQDGFEDLFLPLLLNRDKLKDPQGLTPLHVAYLLKNHYGSRKNGEEILDYLLSIPDLVELDGLQRDQFQTLPHQVTPLPKFDISRRL